MPHCFGHFSLSTSHKDCVKFVYIIRSLISKNYFLQTKKSKDSPISFFYFSLPVTVSRDQELGDAFRKLAESSHESRAEKVADYTLSSCLTEDVSSIELPREVASALFWGNCLSRFSKNFRLLEKMFFFVVKLSEISEGKHRDVHRDVRSFGFRHVWEFRFRCKCKFKLIEIRGANGGSPEKGTAFM